MFRGAAQAGNPEAQYALATLYKDGRGVTKDVNEAARLLAAAAAADNVDAAGRICDRAVQRQRRRQERDGGRGAVEEGRAQGQPGGAEPARQCPRDRPRAAGRPVEAIKWHIVAKAGGVSDLPLDAFVQKQTPEVRAAAEKAAQPWLDAIKGVALLT